MKKLYPTQDAAFRRVDNLKKLASVGGPWPGVAGPNRDGFWYLTFDPDERGGGDG